MESFKKMGVRNDRTRDSVKRFTNKNDDKIVSSLNECFGYGGSGVSISEFKDISSSFLESLNKHSK